MSKLCFTTYVYGWYQDFIPIYIYSILSHWPQHFVKIFLHENLTDANKYSLNLVQKEISDNFEIVENCLNHNATGIDNLAALRFVMPREEFAEFDYVYFGDVDFIIYNCFEDNFYDCYIQHCNQTGLPFSNEWNYDYRHYRATGLHFIIKDPYYDAMEEQINLMRKPEGNWFRNQADSKWQMYDEEMLYYMLCFTFDLRPLIGYRRPLHGLHFGTFRKVNEWGSFVVSKIHSDEKEYLPIWRKDIHKINHILKSKIFEEICENIQRPALSIIQKTKSILFRCPFI